MAIKPSAARTATEKGDGKRAKPKAAVPAKPVELDPGDVQAALLANGYGPGSAETAANAAEAGLCIVTQTGNAFTFEETQEGETSRVQAAEARAKARDKPPAKGKGKGKDKPKDK